MRRIEDPNVTAAVQNPQPTLWTRWKALARRAGNFQARVILTLFYFTLALPFGLAARWGSDPLGLKKRSGTPGWTARSGRASDLDELRRQY